MTGSLATLEVPRKRQEEAFQYLKQEFEKVGCKVTKGDDAGEPTFEIEQSPEMAELYQKAINTDEEVEILEKWSVFVNILLRKYFKKFRRHL